MHKAASVFCALLVFAPALVSCSSGADEPYKPPYPAYSGSKKASLPAVPDLPKTPIKGADGYTVYGATHHLRSLVHSKDVTAAPITIVGYIVETNYKDAPPCAVHETGKGDKGDCVAPIPTFAIADAKGDVKGPKIKVVGWARNYAVIYDAMNAYDKVKPGDKPKELVKDEMWGKELPFPLPAVGAKVKVTGKYGYGQRPSGDMVSDPMNGVVLYEKLETLEPAPEKAAFAKK